MQFKKTTLKNGLRIITVPMKDTQTATVVVAVGVGSRYETDREAGLSHFIEHLFLQGTEKRPSALAISAELDSVGGEHNAFTSKDRTAYYAKVGSGNIELALDVIADIYLNSRIEPKDIEKEKGPIIQEISMYEDNPMRNIGDLFENLIYNGNSLGRDIAGNKKTVQSFRKKDLINYIKRFYLGNDTVVCVAGKINERKVVQQVSRYFSGMIRKKKPLVKRFKNNQKKPAVHIKYKETDQTNLIIGNSAYHENHKDKYVLGVLSTILGGNSSSRLFTEVRDKKGLAYFIYSMVDMFEDCGYFAVQAGVDHGKTGLAIETILGEFEKIATVKVGEKELKKAKDYIKGRSIMGLESSDEVAMFFIEQGLKKKKIMTPKEIFAEIDKVTASDILRVAKDIFQEKTLNLAVIGPHKDSKKIQKILKL